MSDHGPEAHAGEGAGPAIAWEQDVVRLLRELAAGVVSTRLYGAAHPRASSARERLVDHARALLQPGAVAGAAGELVIVLLEQELFVLGRPFTRSSERVVGLVRSMRRHQVERLSLLNGVREEQIQALLEFLAGPEGRPEPRLDRIVLGRAVRRLDEGLPGLAGASLVPPEVALRERLGVVRHAFSSITLGTPIPVAMLEDLVHDLDRRIAVISRPLDLLAPLERDEAWSEVHAHNVAVLTLAMCHPLGVAEPARRELGIAALLHDAGRIGMPLDDVRTDLDRSGTSWEAEDDHPRRGLERLLRSALVPPVASIVAFEHHLWCSGGGFPRLVEPRPQHPAAALVAVAEAFDVLHTVRAPRGRITREGIVATLDELAGTVLEPHAVRAVMLILSAGADPGPDSTSEGGLELE